MRPADYRANHAMGIFVVARRGDQAARALECASEYRFVRHRLDPRVEGREFHLLERLGPPGGYEAPAHRDDELRVSSGKPDQ
jgi:hypothetical protein